MVDLMWLIISGLLVGAALGYFISTLQLTRRIFVSSSKSVAINAGLKKKTQSKEPLQIEKLADIRKKFKMVLVVRNDLKMGKGKIAAQCSHATLGLYKKLLQRAPRALNRWEYCAQPKVVVKIESEEQMLVLQERAKSLQLPTHITIDAGKTQIAPNSRTVMAILGGLKLM
ncbi:PREDICTED: peptidyl-tRNA hydrolase 2, mitochondrial-like isoform X2 [Camelina sativa]|uniref:peptidyl-tRNA hydrolase n=1 Tax=Camelina sativa TaxID=90675 RepID=A0ABM0VZV9_CAMSA|nr:PREDICTED: peptidyl-tRNA hydrolase 2, mitochondrial-like isoform X2 [Camelina sativa]